MVFIAGNCWAMCFVKPECKMSSAIKKEKYELENTQQNKFDCFLSENLILIEDLSSKTGVTFYKTSNIKLNII